MQKKTKKTDVLTVALIEKAKEKVRKELSKRPIIEINNYKNSVIKINGVEYSLLRPKGAETIKLEDLPKYHPYPQSLHNGRV